MQCGGILIVALGALAALSALMLAAAAHVGGGLRLARFFENDLHAGLAARSGVAVALAAVAAQTNAWDAFGDERVREHFGYIPVGGRAAAGLRYRHSPEPGATQTVWGVIGEEGRINLNGRGDGGYDRNLLAALFRAAAGIDAGEAARLAGLLIAERDDLNENARLTATSENMYDDNSVMPSGFRSWHEVMRTEGIDPDVWESIRPYATLYGSGRVNLNLADIATLKAVGLAAGGEPEAARQLAAKITAFREEGGGVFRDARESALMEELGRFRALAADERMLFSAMMPYLTLRSSCFGGESVGWVRAGNDTSETRRGGPDTGSPLTRTVDFVIQKEPLRILYWHEY